MPHITPSNFEWGGGLGGLLDSIRDAGGKIEVLS